MANVLYSGLELAIPNRIEKLKDACEATLQAKVVNDGPHEFNAAKMILAMVGILRDGRSLEQLVFLIVDL